MHWKVHRPTIFLRTPQEYLEEQWKQHIRLPPAPPLGHVRVYVYLEWKEGRDDKELLQNLLYLQGDIPLEPSGELSLIRIRTKWGLEKCVPIDPSRRLPFKAADPDYLSPLAVQVLADENGVLKMFEPKPSKTTIAVREERMYYIRKYEAATDWLREMTINWLDVVLTSNLMVVVFIITTLGVAKMLVDFLDFRQSSGWFLSIPDTVA